MSISRLRDAIFEKIRNEKQPVLMECEILEVNKSAETCNVRHLDTGKVYTDVPLRAFETAKPAVGLVLYPKPGSLAMVALVDQYSTYAFMLNCGEIDEIKLSMNGFQLQVHTDGTVEANKGLNGGLVISKNVAKEINALKEDLNQLKALLAALAATGATLGAAPLPGTAISTFASYAQKVLIPTSSMQLENPKIKHG